MAEKMIFVPANTVTEKTEMRPTFRVLATIENDIRNLLDLEEIADYDRVKLLTHLLQRYKSIYENRPQEAVNVIVKNEQSIKERNGNKEKYDEVLATIPKNLHKKATNLLDIMNADGSVGWDKRGHLVVDGSTVPRTNINDLVEDVVDKKRKSWSPRGWDIFARKLKKLNVPRTLIRNKARWDYSSSENEDIVQTDRTIWEEAE